jgi:hypothetical protein
MRHHFEPEDKLFQAHAALAFWTMKNLVEATHTTDLCENQIGVFRCEVPVHETRVSQYFRKTPSVHVVLRAAKNFKDTLNVRIFLKAEFCTQVLLLHDGLLRGFGCMLVRS